MFLGGPMALASAPLGRPLLFYAGLVLLVVALALPATPGRTAGERARELLRHLPVVRWLGRRD